LELEWKLGFASENISGEPELNSFNLPTSVVLSSRPNPTRFRIRVHHWLLAVGATKTKIPSFGIWTLKLFSSFIFKGYFGSFLIPNIPRSLGFDPKFNPSSGDFLVGYFHSYKWVEDVSVRSQMCALEIRTPSRQLQTLIEEASEKRILIVHIRLGDYEKEFLLGILASSYYRLAIQKAHTLSDFDQIWVFTNDVHKSKTIFPTEWVYKSRWITEVDHSASETLKIMQYGHGYVVGNSTFSWWAAILSKSSEALVFAPDPWFKAAETPSDLIPPTWITIQSEFLNMEREMRT
jgi:hypothetical protein